MDDDRNCGRDIGRCTRGAHSQTGTDSSDKRAAINKSLDRLVAAFYDFLRENNPDAELNSLGPLATLYEFPQDRIAEDEADDPRNDDPFASFDDLDHEEGEDTTHDHALNDDQADDNDSADDDNDKDNDDNDNSIYNLFNARRGVADRE